MLPTGKGEEQALAATVFTLLCLQMGSGPEGEEVFRSLKPLLVSVLTDSTASPSARQSVRPGPFLPGDTFVVGRAQAMPLGALQSREGDGIGCSGVWWGKQGHPNLAAPWLGAGSGPARSSQA